jgi:hypothetical protein
LADSKTSILVGSPRLPSEVFGGRPVTATVANAIRAIPRGRLQETTLSRSSASGLLDRLVKLKIIEPRTYRVRSKTIEGKEVVFIEHTAEPYTPVESHTKAALTPVPSVQEVLQYINEQPERKHTVDDVIQRFLGRHINAHKENALYHKYRSVTLQAQALIVKELGGKFITEMMRNTNFYRWTK